MVEATSQTAKRRTRISRPYPQHKLREVLEITRSIHEKNAGLPFDRVRLAKAIGTTPASSAFMMKLNSSAKYGLTEGGYSDARISLTALGAKVAKADPAALIEAAMRPETFRAFYELLDGKRIPGSEEASGIIIDDIGIPESLASEFLEIVVRNGELLGIVTEAGNSHYVSLADLTVQDLQASQTPPTEVPKAPPQTERPAPDNKAPAEPSQPAVHRKDRGRLLVAHSGAGAIADRIVRTLDGFSIPHSVVEIDPIDSSPLSSEWDNGMDGCSGAIIVMAGPSRVVSTPGVASSRTSKMLLQLGAAVDRFKDQVVMVVGQESDHFLQTIRIQRVYADGDDSGKFEVDLLRGLMTAEMMLVSVPSRNP